MVKMDNLCERDGGSWWGFRAAVKKATVAMNDCWYEQFDTSNFCFRYQHAHAPGITEKCAWCPNKEDQDA